MANEITVSGEITMRNGGVVRTRGEFGTKFDQTTANSSGGTQTISASGYEQVIITADIVAPGIAFFKNLDATNFVELGSEVVGPSTTYFHPFAKLEAGQFAVVPLAGDVFAIADTAPVKIEFEVFDR